MNENMKSTVNSTFIVGSIFALIVAIGIVHGMYLWFGGYKEIHYLANLCSIFLGALCSFIIYKKLNSSYIVLAACFLLSQMLYFLSLNLGKVLYYEPLSNSELSNLFLLAISGQL